MERSSSASILTRRLCASGSSSLIVSSMTEVISNGTCSTARLTVKSRIRFRMSLARSVSARISELMSRNGADGVACLSRSFCSASALSLIAANGCLISWAIAAVNSPMVASPLHRLDCCVISDGGGALVVTRPEIAKSLNLPLVKVIGVGESPKHQMGGDVDLVYSAARWSGPPAWEMAGVTPADIKYASIYDSFTITVLMQLEDLGFCKKGEGGKFVADGNLISGVGKLPFNTDGGGLCSNHPANRGGITKIIEAVRQLRGEAHPKLQVKNCDLAIAHGTGGSLGTRHCGSTVILERE